MSKEAIIELEYLPVDALTPYENNTRAHGDTDVDAICESISQFGFSDPIGVWGAENVIVEGHGRLTAAKRLGLDTVPVIHLDHLTDEQRRAYAIAHNKTAELSKWDFEKLDLEMASLKKIDFVALGFAPVTEIEGGRSMSGLTAKKRTETPTKRETTNITLLSINSSSRKLPTIATRRTTFTTL